jgi:hypothetical protein
MGLFSRFKKNKDPTASDTTSNHHHREPANPLEEVAEAKETSSLDGALGPRIATPSPNFAIRGKKDPLASEEIRAAADPEDDNAREQLIEDERRAEEHGF